MSAIKLLIKYRHIKYWLSGFILWIILFLKYAFDHLFYPGQVMSYTYYNYIIIIVSVPYLAGIIIHYLYSKYLGEKFVWTIKNHLKFWFYGIVMLAIWLLIVFAFEPFLPDWWNNTYTLIFFATFPSYFSGLVLHYVIEKLYSK